MSYLSKKLTAGEELVYTTKLHWGIFVNCLLKLLILIALVVAVDTYRLWGYFPQIAQYRELILVVLFTLFFLLPFLRTLIRRQTTHFAITNERVLIKRRLIAVDLKSMPLNKIENVDSQQTVMGRIFNYGDVMIKGSGSTPLYILGITRPMRFRQYLSEQRDIDAKKQARVK